MKSDKKNQENTLSLSNATNIDIIDRIEATIDMIQTQSRIYVRIGSLCVQTRQARGGHN